MKTQIIPIEAPGLAILRYLKNEDGWRSKGWIRRKLQADGYEIDPIENDWLAHILDSLVTENILDRRARTLDTDEDHEVTIHFFEYRLARIAKD